MPVPPVDPDSAQGPPPVLSYPPPPAHATPAQQHEYERGRWNHFLLDDTWRRTRFNAQPNALLVEAVRHQPPGRALDVNMGEGRNALYLAQLGWQVTGIDFAEQALAFAQQRAQALGLVLTTIAQDLRTFAWDPDQWDLLVLSYADDSAHVAEVHRALKPGGLVVFENFHAEVNQAWNTPPDQQVGFATDELPALYTAAGFRILHYKEPVKAADFTRETHRLVQLVAQKC
ncbi:class I SAM-dependent methyltransferase [Hymenobacter metallicola]|uniref:Class I SAM-dependent methyltransferase n=1 Tax=Hymenobacter metallicola TaxID=2563114 RepID=A0A4Z0QBX0_9BACT|nr:class I SAM-dependent methyltransferase [Hymenobacter metallicola]TGE27588.1 class I SAM-dependent methyltransferase [Hymenobacter metallicola]